MWEDRGGRGARPRRCGAPSGAVRGGGSGGRENRRKGPNALSRRQTARRRAALGAARASLGLVMVWVQWGGDGSFRACAASLETRGAANPQNKPTGGREQGCIAARMCVCVGRLGDVRLWYLADGSTSKRAFAHNNNSISLSLARVRVWLLFVAAHCVGGPRAQEGKKILFFLTPPSPPPAAAAACPSASA